METLVEAPRYLQKIAMQELEIFLPDNYLSCAEWSKVKLRQRSETLSTV
jgi:hypothetical protein